ncbi:MAG TPA: carboxymethylenebutenolidase [Cyanobacteria bacterium UBA11149]|nr:carboxymethylenebutenolidase [Cyanobacteria bacterium UBA11367]HBE57089.1 carboxymethylenebutenolidase [Cyanobacteria bacterium UBA11366]HBK65921.1 carboxymethylenebutenolidase [Cyanobacteria bacterium UBA11166]HBR75287.1 carboxymethylenebutenolidase [Cyanobacteria bacterium UBA11159]HBS71440.1 carboxymethylenebutenolidase [Cyanobacteria bacterium UBA11153]HBW88797.1 carboxymethylenebutenolidase [Cyanobacteria bacterium UBA11149]HCA96935.1 carboxymethylenebutenolidase [Cyanobacteria bacter
MTDREIKTDWVKIINGTLEIAAYIAMPVGDDAYPGVVVCQEIFGVNDHIRDVTRRIAREGYIAIAPALYQRQAPGFETGYTQEDIKIGRQYKEKTKASEILGDIQATINYLNTQTPIKPGAIGCIGFCFGGHVAYLAATIPNIKATASFYGAGITTMTPGGGLPTINRTKDIKGTIYAFFGMEDNSIPLTQVDEIEAELRKYQIKHQVFRYQGADHGFYCDRRSSYNEAAAKDAWAKVQDLFKQELV